VLLMLQLYSVSPLLPLVPIVALGIVIHFLVLSNKNSAMLERRGLEESTEPLAGPMAERDPPLQLPSQGNSRHRDTKMEEKEKEDGNCEGREEGEERQIVWEEDEDEEDLGFSSGDEEDEDAEDGRQIEWEEEDEEDDQLESVFAEDEKSRWGSSSSGSSSLQDSQVSAQDWLQLVAAAVGEFWKEEELSVEWSESSEEGSDSVAE
jgi:hypothetical protein